MRLNLKQLVIITCIALAGIISLQIFWLVKTYAEKQEQLQSTVSNTMLQTQLFTGTSPVLNSTVSTMTGSIIDNLGEIDKNDPDIISIQKTYNIKSDTGITQGSDTSLKNGILKMLGLDSFRRKEYTLKAYKQKLEQAFAAQNIHMPIEAAVFDAAGRIIACTIDTAAFNNTKAKSSKEYSLPIQLNKDLSGRLQLAFPDMFFYLLRGMALLLILSLLFVIVCCFSFTYMVALFFRQKKLADIRNDFMNNMTHELKTPISSALLALELLQDSSVSVTEEQQRHYFRIAGNELNRLSMLVDKVLKMAAFERTEITLYYSHFAVADWLEQIINTAKPIAGSHPISINTQVNPVVIDLWGDKEHLTGLMQNLLENAIKYRNRNRPELDIKVKIEEEGIYNYITVEDNGAGIAPEYLEKIFDKFFRVPTGDLHETKGYGLGLSYVQEIVKLHKGTIRVKSEITVGTRFYIKLPKKTIANDYNPAG